MISRIMVPSFSLEWQWLPALLLLLIPIFSILLLTSRRNKKESGGKLPPGPPKLPIIGNLHQLGNLPHRSLHNLCQKYGPIMFLQLGRVPTVAVSSPEMAKEVMKTHDLDCCSRPESPGSRRLSYNHLDVAFAPYTHYWREMRKLFIVELVSMKRVQSFAYARESQVDKLITSLSQATLEPVNLNEKIFSFTDGVIGTAAFGEIYGSEQFKDFQNVLNEAMDMLAGFSAEDFFPLIGPVLDKLTGLIARRERLFQQLDGYYQAVIDHHLDPERPRPDNEDLVDLLIGLLKCQRGKLSLTLDHVKGILMDTFIGATGTSSVTSYG